MAWVGLAMAGIGLTWWFRRMGRTQIPRNRVPFLVWMLCAGVLGGVGIAEGGGWLAWVPGGLAVLSAIFVLATISISRQKVDGAVGVGDPMPDFQAPDDSGSIPASLTPCRFALSST